MSVPPSVIKAAAMSLLKKLPKPTKRDALVAVGALGTAAATKRLVDDVRMAEQMRAQQRQYGG